MDETMKNETEVMAETLSDVIDDMSREDITSAITGGPSKGFMALVVGGVAAIAIGAVVAVKRHKNKKASDQDLVEDLVDPAEDEFDDEDDGLMYEEVQDEKSAKEKK